MSARDELYLDYVGLYEDLLLIERRARTAGFVDFAKECFEFRVDLLLRFKTFLDYVVL